MVRGDIVKIGEICSSLSCLTGAKPLVVCVSHRCSQTKQTKKNKKKKRKILAGRGREQAATSAPGNRQLRRVTGDQLQRMAHLHPSLPASHLLSNSPSPQPAHQMDAFDIYTAFNTSETGDLFRQRPWLKPGLDLGWPPWRPCSSALKWGRDEERGAKGKKQSEGGREGMDVSILLDIFSGRFR